MDSEPGTSKETNEQLLQSQRVNRGGKNCCVPLCGNNSRRNPLLSFHKIPKDETLRKKWIKLLRVKGLRNPTDNHRVCSAHFPGGKRTYDNNIPTILETSKPVKQRRLIVKHKAGGQETSSANIVTVEREPVETFIASNTQEQLEDLNTADIVSMEKEHVEQHTPENIQGQLEDLKVKYKQLEDKYNRDTKELKNSLFRLERFISSDIDFKFYTGFPDYTTFKAFFNYLSPECCHLNYHGSTTAPILSDTQKKRRKQRSLSPEEELFMVLSRLRCGFIGQDLAHRYGISPSHLS